MIVAMQQMSKQSKVSEHSGPVKSNTKLKNVSITDNTKNT